MKQLIVPISLSLLSAVAFAQSDRIQAGTEITVRTTDRIEANAPSDFRIFRGVIDRDVPSSGRVVIPRGSDAELILRQSSDKTMTLDLESVM